MMNLIIYSGAFLTPAGLCMAFMPHAISMHDGNEKRASISTCMTTAAEPSADLVLEAA